MYGECGSCGRIGEMQDFRSGELLCLNCWTDRLPFDREELLCPHCEGKHSFSECPNFLLKEEG